MKSMIVAGGIALVAMTGSALADGRVWAQDASGNYNGFDNGGAFIMHRIGTNGTNGYHANQNNAGYVGDRLGEMGLGASSFYTFCIERGETINVGNSNGTNNRYYVEIADSARNGGNGTSNAQAAGPRPNGAGEDVLSFATAAIYQEFRNGGNFGGIGTVLGGYGAETGETGGRRMASAVQWAIWYAENEIDWNHRHANNADGNAIRDLGRSIFTWANQASVHGNTLGNVRVLRLWTSYDPVTGEYSGNSQDQLTLIPLPTGAGLAMAGLGLLAIRRRTTR